MLGCALSFLCSTLAFRSWLSYFGTPFSILILFRLWLDEKTPTFSFSSPAKVEIRAIGEEIHLVKLVFSAKTEISGEDFSRAEEKNTPQKVVFAPKVTESDEKGRFGGGNHREGMKRKIELYCRFCHAMK